MFQKISSFHKIASLLFIGAIFFCLIFVSNSVSAFGWELDKNRPMSSCFIMDKHGNIMMVKNRATGKYHLPGGPIADGTAAKDAALWYVIRDTGFDSHIGYKLDQIGNHSIYTCAILTPRTYFVTQANKKVVIEWVNLLATKEVSQPLLMPNDEETRLQYANFEETKYFDKWIENGVSSRFILVEDGVEILPKYYQVQHEWLTTVRDLALSFKFVTFVAKFFPTLSSILIPLLFILCVPLFRAYYGARPVLIFSAGLVYLGLVSILMSNYVPIIPPSFVDHSFISSKQFFFSFPAIEVLFFAFVFSWIIFRLPSKKYIKEKIWLGFAGTVLVFISSVKAAIYGENYPSTILISIFMALIWSFLLKAARKVRLGDRKRALVTTRFWIFTSLLLILLAPMIESIRIRYLEAFCLGISFSLVLLKIVPNYLMVVKKAIKLKFFISGVIGLLVIFYITIDYLPIEPSKVNTFRVKMFLMPVWLMIINPWLFKKYFIKKQTSFDKRD